MSPTLEPGSVLLAFPLPKRWMRPGCVILAQHPTQGRLLTKRLVTVRDSGVTLGSDDPVDSQDSRHFGTVPWDKVAGRVLFAWTPGRGVKLLRTRR